MKRRSVLHVTSFGAVGDGIADDTAAIQSAFDFLSTNHGGRGFGQIIFDPGFYRTTSSIEINTDYCHPEIVGHGWLNSIIEHTGKRQCGAFHFTGSTEPAFDASLQLGPICAKLL